MFDVTKPNEYREDNRLEVKRAQKDLPDSLWSTYSAFANTYGGVIVLGAEENDDKSLRISGLTNADHQIKVFWDTINNRKKVSVNILCDRNVQKIRADEKEMIVIEVPRALRQDRPVFINGNMYGGTYRRNGEGDYRCTESSVKNMIRDAGEVTQDRLILDNMSMDVLDRDTIKRYRLRFSNLKPDHVWANIPDQDFLMKIGAVKRSEENGKLHPTAAGLLMFGYDHHILDEYPNYFLDYREPYEKGEGERWSDRVTSSTGDWSGNLFDFYYRVQDRLTSDLKVPFVLRGWDRIDDTKMHKAVREALANALIHSDYYERRGLVIEKWKRTIKISNPGALRISRAEALNGGVSDTRNSALFLMFALVDIGERAGSGLMNIEETWKETGLPSPVLSERFDPDRTFLVLPLAQNVGINGENVGINGENVGINGENVGIKLTKTENKILDLLANNSRLTVPEIAAEMDLDTRTIDRGLKKLRDNNIITRVGSRKNGEWKVMERKE